MNDMRNAILGAALVAGLAGCTASEAPTSPGAGAVLNAAAGVQITVTGGGMVDLTSINAGYAQFSVSAVLDANGVATGKFHQRREIGGFVMDFSGDVTCLTIDAATGRARIGGVVTQNNSTHPGLHTENHEIGDDVWFRVVDGGEGNGAVDASTTYGFKPTLVNTSAEYCALPFEGLPWWNPASTFPLAHGNIQIRSR